MTWHVREALCRSKFGAQAEHRNEDALSVWGTPEGGQLIAAIDGITDKGGVGFALDGRAVSSGRFVAKNVAAALGEVAAWPIEARGPVPTVEHLTAVVRAAVGAQHPDLLTGSTRPGCSIIVLDTGQEQMWRVGDCVWAGARSAADETGAPELLVDVPEKLVDTVAIDIRVRVEIHHTTSGGDLGRDAIAGILLNQGWLANLDCAAGYGAIDGTDVPARFIETWNVADFTHLVLASDGYSKPDGALRDAVTAWVSHDSGLWVAEQILADAVKRDPRCVGELRGTKAVAADAESFDDRTWVGVTRP